MRAGARVLIVAALTVLVVAAFPGRAAGSSSWNRGHQNTTTSTTSTSTTTSTTAVSSVLFEDDFSGSAGAVADPAKWIYHAETCNSLTGYTCIRNANTFQDGAGDLVLRISRSTDTTHPFNGGWIDSFNYGYGWPPSNVKATFAVPFHVEMRAKQPPTAGAWTALWAVNTDRTTAQNIYELDVAEERMTLSTTAGCHQHTWLSGADKAPWDGRVTVTDMGANWHVYAADVFADHVAYTVDGLACGTAYGVSGSLGLLLDNVVAAPGSWGSAGGQPLSSDPGPWDLVVDYVKITR